MTTWSVRARAVVAVAAMSACGGRVELNPALGGGAGGSVGNGAGANHAGAGGSSGAAAGSPPVQTAGTAGAGGSAGAGGVGAVNQAGGGWHNAAGSSPCLKEEPVLVPHCSRWREFPLPLPDESCTLRLPAEDLVRVNVTVWVDCDILDEVKADDDRDGWRYLLHEGEPVEQIGIVLIGEPCDRVRSAEAGSIYVYDCPVSVY